MTIASLLKISTALPVAALLALAGCGGGGSQSNNGDDNRPNTPVSLMPATGLKAGEQARFAASAGDTLAALLPNASNSFSALSSSLRAHSEGTTPAAETTDRFSIKSVASDGDGGFHVTYVIDGVEAREHFSKDDFREQDQGYTITKNGRDYFLFSRTGSFDGAGYGENREFDYVRAMLSSYPGDSDAHWARSYLTYGARTLTSGMPTGTATYIGRTDADLYDNTLDSISTRVARSRVRGSVALTADFADATVEGRIFRLSIQRPGESNRTQLPTTTRFEITGGRIVNGQFTGTLTGVDSNPTASLDESVRGFEGSMLGEFYGPAAEEVGGVLNATRAEGDGDNWTALGWFGGSRASTFSTRADNQPLSAGVDRSNYSSASPRITAQDADNRVTSVMADGAGGYRISYLVAGQSQTVTLDIDDIDANAGFPDAWSKRDGIQSWGFRRPFFAARVPQGRYFNAKDWSLAAYPDADSTSLDSASWVSVIHGERTASMPRTGAATYAGRAAAHVFDPSPGQGLASVTNAEGYSGRLTLSADFAAGSISGMIGNLEHSQRYFAPAGHEYQAVPGAFTISDGTISGNDLSASLSGLGYSGRVTGAFYGPNAAEAAGVMQATHADNGKLLHGWLGGARQ
ncbi:MAG: transferrin-binding protein-like solute binding protein [Alphaproteobacteria bacterium]|nr:transferrin-binding protein-like solute binding protein [Alphaproteobacteria bacterium]